MERPGFFSVFRNLLIDGEDKNSFLTQLTDRNVKRLNAASKAVILLVLVHFIIFISGLNASSGEELMWRKLLVINQIMLLLSALILTLVTGILQKNELLLKKYGQTIVYSAFIVILILGISYAGIDQLINAGIVPYIIICMALPLVLLVPEYFAIMVYSVSFLVFSLVISIFQPNKEMTLAFIINGMTSSALGAFLAILMWQQFVKQFKQDKKIRRQTEILEKQNLQLETIAEGLRQANETKDKFFSIIAHDLRSPFNTIAGFSDLILETLENKNYNETSQYAEIIRQSTYRATDLLSNITEWSRSQTGQLRFMPDHISLLQIVNEIQDLFENSLAKKGIRIDNQVNTDCRINADRGMISTILRNLISNAIKFTPRGGNITISTEQRHGDILINVSDTGIGIPVEIQEKLFLTGENCSTAGTENEQGTGLGLILCREFVEKHGGMIGLESTPGSGSRFYFTIPHRDKTC